MKICKLCGHSFDSLSDSHIIPRSFFEYSKKQAGQLKNGAMSLITNSQEHFPFGRLRIGWYDNNLLCKECEAKFSVYDDYASTLLLNQENLHQQMLKNGELKGWLIQNFDFDKLSIFITFVLWRASVSSIMPFKKIKLKQSIEDALKKSILTGKPIGKISFFITRFSDALGKSFMLDSHPELKSNELGKIGVFRFYFGAGYVVYVKVGNKKLPTLFNELVISKNKPLLIMAKSDFSLSKEFKALKKIINDADELQNKIKNNQH